MIRMLSVGLSVLALIGLFLSMMGCLPAGDETAANDAPVVYSNASFRPLVDGIQVFSTTTQDSGLYESVIMNKGTQREGSISIYQPGYEQSLEFQLKLVHCCEHCTCEGGICECTKCVPGPC